MAVPLLYPSPVTFPFNFSPLARLLVSCNWVNSEVGAALLPLKTWQWTKGRYIAQQQRATQLTIIVVTVSSSGFFRKVMS
jgi:hypothetical protein